MFVSFLVFEQFIGVDSVFVVNTSVPLSDTDKFGTRLNEEFGSPVSNVTETLNAEGFTYQTLLDSKNLTHLRVIQDLFCCVENTESGRFSSSTDTTKISGFTGRDGI
jgi:hypothetical protein